MGAKDDVISLSSYVFDRTRRRLDGLGDAEYLWEPVDASWSIRLVDEKPTADWGPFTDPAPFTTIAWRLWHLTATYGADRNAEWLLAAMAQVMLDAPPGHRLFVPSTRSTTLQSGGTSCCLHFPRKT